MKKLKKVFMSFGAFIIGTVSKVSAVATKYGIFAPEMVEDKYGVYDPNIIDIPAKYGVFEPVEPKYGILEPTISEKLARIGKFAIPVILFFIGLFVILNKKITKKTKAIVVSILVILAIFGYVLMNYIATNF